MTNNTTPAAVRENVQANLAAGWREIVPHETNDIEVAILGGGPSLPAHEPEIRALQRQGAKLVTLNGAYGWALARGLGPVTQVMVDARPFNARFVQPVRADCLYLMASQVHPSALAPLPRDRVWLWHASINLIRDFLEARGSFWSYVPGGSTVLLRAIPLLRTLGFRRFHLFGCDSCLMDGAHHAYAQPENDGAAVWVYLNEGAEPRPRFLCQPWMISQAVEFMDLIKSFGDVVELAVYGDGLLAHIIRTAATLELESGAPVERS